MCLALGALFALPACAQQAPQAESGGPLINIRVSRTTEAVNYRDRTSTKIDFQGTALMPRATGRATVDARQGRVAVKAEFNSLEPATSYGSVYLTYVLWAISPEGSASNLGELLLDGRKAKIEVTTKLQTFGMIVTAEPYFAVTFPSDVVVLDNVVRQDTKGTVTAIDAKYALLQRGRYDQLGLQPLAMDPEVPLALYEARNAARIAQGNQAEKYAPDSWKKAQDALARAEDYETRKQRKSVPTAARDAVQAAEDARSIAVKRMEDERVAQQQAAADEQAAQARAAQASEAKAREEAERQKMQADLAAAQARAAQAEEAQARAQAEAARQAAMLKEQQAREQAEQSAQAAAQAAAAAKAAQEQAAQSEREKEELRAKLYDQFNRILETRDTDRGLVINMGDVLFDTAKYNLRPAAREVLAKLSGIMLNYPGLQLTIEGHTDSTGSDEFNQKLSEERAGAVRDYLVGQGLDASKISAAGLGPGAPVADNSTAAGRQKNRRVEIIVSGEVIGTKIGTH